MTSRADLLRQVGVALYGATSWQAPLARDLGVSDRTMRRWVRGDYEPPEGVWLELADLCDDRSSKLRDLSQELRSGKLGPRPELEVADSG